MRLHVRVQLLSTGSSSRSIRHILVVEILLPPLRRTFVLAGLILILLQLLCGRRGEDLERHVTFTLQ